MQTETQDNRLIGTFTTNATGSISPVVASAFSVVIVVGLTAKQRSDLHDRQ